MSEPLRINLEFTPNPNTLKFVLNRDLTPRFSANFKNVSEAEHSPLARRVFAVNGIEAVLIGTNFVTITKAANGDWDLIADAVPKAIEAHFVSNQPHFDSQWSWETPSTGSADEIEQKIRQILDSEIRPAVAMDGGDIVFDRYENGVVYLHLQGSCSSCPSAIATLRMGVENRLKQSVPEVKEVVQV